jgi:NADH-quinone oxidoreductase subunit C/D
MSKTVNPGGLRPTILQLKKDRFDILLDLVGIDYLTHPDHTKENKRFAVVYLFRHNNFKVLATVKCLVDDESLELPSICDLYDSANVAEREVYDQFGIKFKHHPNLKRILNHHQFKGHPLRKNYEITNRQLCTSTDDLMDEMLPKLEAKGYSNIDDLMLLNLGPSHPATHGTIRIFSALDGEKIVASVMEIGYLHRGFEKSSEQQTYNQIIPYTDRLNYCSAILNNIAFSKTIEEMLEVDIPPRAKFIRIIMGELSRIIDHLVCNAANLVDMGALTNYWYLFNPRDEVYDLLSKLTGARFTNSYTRIGGLAHDLYDGFDKDLEHCLQSIQKGMNDTLGLIEHNRIFHDRTQNVGVINKDFALSNGLVGPVLRASGVAYDMRKDNPYYGYEDFDFEIPVGSCGDLYDRIMVRFEEIRQSIDIIRQAMRHLPSGDIIIKDGRIALPPKTTVYDSIEGCMNQFKLVFEGVKVPSKEHYSAIESANGEMGFYVVSDGSGRPYRVKLRSPGFYGLGAFPKIIEGSYIADTMVNMGSMNFIAGEFDR